MLERQCRIREVQSLNAAGALLVVIAWSLATPPRIVQAQQPTTAAGQVLRPRDSDTIPVPGTRVILHRVGRETQGPLDSVLADASGRFRFRFRPDTAAIYLLSARWGDVEYFSPPVHTNPARPDTTMRVVVYDTSSNAPIGIEARHIVVPRS